MKTKTYDAFDEYFNALKKIGYMRWSAVSRLLVLSVLQEKIDNGWLESLDQQKKMIVVKAVQCLSQSECMIPNFDVEDFKPETDLKYYGFIIRNINKI